MYALTVFDRVWKMLSVNLRLPECHQYHVDLLIINRDQLH